MPKAKTYYLRNPKVAVLGRSSELIAIAADGTTNSITGDIAALYQILEVLREPTELRMIATRFSMSVSVAKRRLRELERDGLIISGSLREIESVLSRPATASPTPICNTLILGVSGTIQAASIIALAHGLKDTIAREVQVVLTENATKLLPETVVSYFGLPVWSDPFKTVGSINVPHIWLAERAELIVIMPASAHTIHRLATGACSDLLSLVVAATAAPVVVVPTMNATMFSSPPIKRNISQIRKDGLHVLEPNLGIEVSKTAVGHLKYTGLGIGAAGLTPILKAVLSLHRKTQHNRGEADD